MTLLPFLLLLFVAWSIARGDRWALPVGAGVGSFLVQTHVGYALVVTVVVIAAVVALVVSERGHDEERRWHFWWPTLAVTGAVLFVFWLPVVVQQLTQDPGNVSQLVDFFGNHGREQRYEDAWHVLALQLGVWPDWLKGASAPSLIGTVDFSAALPVPLGLFALLGATVLAWRRARPAFLLDCIVLAALAATFVAMTRIVGDVLTYLVQWTWALGTATWIAIAWSCIATWQAREPEEALRSTRAQRIAGIGLYVVVIAFAAVVVVDSVAAARAGTPHPEASAAMKKLGDAAFAALPGRDGVVEVRVRGHEGAYWASAGVADVLEHHGVDVRVGPELEFAYGSHRLVGTDPVRAVVLVADKGALASARALPGYRSGRGTEASPCSWGRPEPGPTRHVPRRARVAPETSQTPTATAAAPMTAHTACLS